ncbi:MAG: hypothetical protein ACRD8K_02435 [Nitrososphaeraceae archaeon]
MSSNIDWNDVIKKEARGINNEDFGEVQDIHGQFVVVQKGIVDKEKFYIPKDLANSYDGTVLKFKFSEKELSKYQYGLSFEDADDTKEMQEEITVQDADFKNKTKAVKNKKEEINESHNSSTEER